tara:strand:- start:619 stop:897 length:279 start_codon:yes stop_codon:yes gene_type:complete
VQYFKAWSFFSLNTPYEQTYTTVFSRLTWQYETRAIQPVLVIDFSISSFLLLVFSQKIKLHQMFFAKNAKKCNAQKKILTLFLSIIETFYTF